MKKNIIITDDGSKSLFVPQMNETYHSTFGAITESIHVYIEAGYKQIKKTNLAILEIGFGTGINVLLTLLEQQKDNKNIYFETIEKYPLTLDIIQELNNFKTLDKQTMFAKLHQVEWNEPVVIMKDFMLHKKIVDLLNFTTDKKFDLVYFDAFAPDKQPELWTNAVFSKLYNLLYKDGILVTYSAKGAVRRTLQEVGFKVERIPGPPKKREMIRAIKM